MDEASFKERMEFDLYKRMTKHLRQESLLKKKMPQSKTAEKEKDTSNSLDRPVFNRLYQEGVMKQQIKNKYI